MKKIATLSLAACISLSLATTSNAGSLRDFTDSVYRSFTTSGGPDNFRSSSGDNVYTGGAYSLRFGVEDVQLIDFQPPSVSASCSGIDFFAGSIGFGSRDEVIQLGRNIAAAATVYAFKLALNSVCPSCASIMQNIQAWVEKLNALANMSCQDALKVMEDADKEEESKPPSDSDWNTFGQKVEGWTDPESYLGSDTTDNYLKRILAKGIEIADMLEKSPGKIPDTTDIGFFIAYNTNIHSHLFPFYDEDLAKAATWSVLSEGKKCISETQETADGSYCGLSKSDYAHQYSDFIYGNNMGDSADMSTLTLPDCRETKSIGTTSFGSFVVCDYTEKTYTEVVKAYPTKAPALKYQIMEDVFGSQGINSEGNPVIEDICEGDYVKKGVDSMFAKNLTVGNGYTNTLTDSQAWIASLLGTQYTRDLYRLNAKGEYLDITEVNSHVECGALVEVVREKTENVIDRIESKVVVEMIHFSKKVQSKAKFADVWQKVQAAVLKLAGDVKGSLEIRKAENLVKNSEGKDE
ncbi:conjugal transfer protein TraH [Vibrio sp. 10N.239.312.D08]|uniref:conjugal transfer protein TraH n=1 Tax=Vibrio sp. 10N.239.312.D08 TaxID=3229978 RepID=UPI003550BD12